MLPDVARYSRYGYVVPMPTLPAPGMSRPGYAAVRIYDGFVLRVHNTHISKISLSLSKPKPKSQLPVMPLGTLSTFCP